MNRKHISSNLQMKVRQYLRFIWQEELTQNADLEDSIMNKLSRSLKEELFLEANGSLLNKHSMFFANFSESMLRCLMYKMKEIRFNPEDMIFSENIPDDCEIYFILKGKVQISISSINRHNSRLSLTTLNKGDVFGEMAFFTGKARIASAQSKDFCSLLYIRREDFLNVLAKFPEDYEKLCLIKDQIMISHNYNSINMSCYSCKQFDHLITNCPLLHYSNTKRHLHKVQYDPQQPNRKLFLRREFKTNSLAKLSMNISSAAPYQTSSDRLNRNESFETSPFLINQNNLQVVQEEEESFNRIELPQLQISGSGTDMRINNDEININSNENLGNSERRNTCTFIRLPRSTTEEKGMLKSIIKGLDDGGGVYAEFDKLGNFKNYYPEYNLKNILQKNFTRKRDIQAIKTRNKFQNYFLLKSKLIKTPLLVKRNSFARNFTLDHLKKKKMTSIFTENEVNQSFFGKKQTMNFYDLVFEVLTNEDLKKKLALIKGGISKRKKKRSMGKLFKL